MTEVKPTQGFQQAAATAEEDPFAPLAPVVVTEAELAMAKTSRFFGQIEPRPAPRHRCNATLRR